MSEYFRKPIVKILMLKGQEGQSIKSIEKTSTSGIVDTYTITLTDGRTSTFTVTNGGNGNEAEIEKINKALETNTSNIATNTANISANKADITSLQQTTQTNTSNIATNTSDIQAIKSRDDDQDTNIARNTSDIAKLNTIRVNLLKPTLQTTTKNGVTCTNNGDHTYTLNGISQNSFDFPLCNFDLPKGTYKFVGSLQNDGDYFTYVINHTLNENYIGDVGNGYIFTINQTCNLTFLLWGKQNITFNNLLFKPMLTTNLNATYNDFIACLGTSWTKDATNGYYTQSIICSGITSDDNPTIDVVLSGTLTKMQSQQEEWGKILKVETSSNTLTFYASEPTTVSLSVMVKGV